ncbi:hypothetical protein MPTK2_1g18440 [Marchantia polymorpha subsp. ruderalis]
MYFLRPRGKGGVVEDKKILKANLWSSLPDDLVERVLTKLSFSTLFKCRTVCKRWNELILSQNFIPANQDPPKCIPFHFTFYTPPEHKGLHETQYFTAYDPRRNSWVELSLSFLKLDPDLGNWEMAASGGGLLCLATISCSQFVVCNPVTKQWRLLEFPSSLPPSDIGFQPRPLEHVPANDFLPRPLEHLLVGLIVNQNTGLYKLVIAEIYESSQRTTLVYDSKNRAWKKGANTPSMPHSCFSLKPGVACKGALYWITDDDDWRFPRLFKYDVENDSWTTALLTSYGWDVRILEHRNELILMTEDGRACILHESGKEMRLTQKKMPKPLLGKLGRQTGDSVQNSSCIGAGELICFVKEVLTERKYRTRLEFIVRDFSKNTSTSTTNLEYGYALLCWVIEPSLTALA